MTKDALETLGTKISPQEDRDAIHLAVLPLEAEHILVPGEHIGVVDGKGSGRTDNMIGIVDPFLKEPVGTGEFFWLMVYPRTITSLRHVWTHPNIEGEDPVSDEKVDSEEWLRTFIANSDCPDYHTVLSKALSRDGGWDSEYLHFDGQDAHGEIPPEFWDHVEAVTGQRINKDDRAKYFSCGC